MAGRAYISPLYSISVTELIEMLGPDFDIDLEIERMRYTKTVNGAGVAA